MKRRTFTLLTTQALAATAWGAESRPAPFLSTNIYPWGTFAKRDGKPDVAHGDDMLAAIRSAGIDGYEGIFDKTSEFDGLDARLKSHQLTTRSLYTNSTLHEPESARRNIDHVLAIAKLGAAAGAKIIVTNPSPINWNGVENKTDAQLVSQAKALNTLGAELRELGLQLAYHNHDAELRQGGREFHHMLAATDPANVKFCLDAHWIYRGCGDSQVAVFDALELYGERVVELHLRQSQGGVWSEAFTGAGDIDYVRMAAWLDSRKIRPHLCLEQAVEAKSPKTMDVVAAHKLSATNARATFAAFL